MKLSSSCIVVDADIARSSGTSEHPVSRTSREVLDAVLESSLEIAFSSPLLSEWRIHRSIFAQKWLASMFARKRVKIVLPSQEIELIINNSPISEKQKKIASKDAHIIDIAISTEKFIASNDKTARDVFCLIAKDFSQLRDVVWVIPIQSAAEFRNIIKDGGFVPPAWYVKIVEER